MESNQSRPPVLFIHGAFGRPSLLKPWIDFFGQAGFDCVAPALPGRDPSDDDVLRRTRSARHSAAGLGSSRDPLAAAETTATPRAADAQHPGGSTDPAVVANDARSSAVHTAFRRTGGFDTAPGSRFREGVPPDAGRRIRHQGQRRGCNVPGALRQRGRGPKRRIVSARQIAKRYGAKHYVHPNLPIGSSRNRR